MKTPPWNLEQKQQALKRGSHQSAKQHSGFLWEEFVDIMRKNQWVILPADLVLHEPNLRLSPLGVVPQRDRRPRTICDYSFFLVTLETIPLAPSEAMQFGRALWRVLSAIHHADPRVGPVYLSKIDIADGFYRIGVNDVDVAKLGIVVPTKPGEPQVIGFPLVLPMGWMQSPPLFTAATETVADIANQALQHSAQSCPYRLDVLSESVAPPPLGGPPALTSPTADPVPHRRAPQGRPLPAVKKWDVYVDDFIGMVQGGWRHRRHVKRVLLHTLDRVFRPLDSGDSEQRQEPASVKKLRKGDATWSTRKVILGWIIDSIQLTLELPFHLIARLFELLDSVVSSQRRVSTRKWQKLLGELWSMVLAVPGARGLFSVLQLALKVRLEEGTRLRLTDQVHAVLRDFRALATELQSRPTRISELVPSTTPATMGAQDAAGKGMGGVHFVPMPDGPIAPLLWRAQFPWSVQNCLVTYANPASTITNSELELSASIAQHDVLAREVDVREATILNLSDNTPTFYWQRKGAVSSAGPAARLLRIQALHQRQHRYVPTFDYLPGPANVMSDDCSRRWDLTHAQLLHHFNSSYPQTQPWRLCQLSKRMHSGLISALLTK
jgi:hypothetical protein